MSDFLQQSALNANAARFQGQADAAVNRAKSLSAPKPNAAHPAPGSNEAKITEAANGFESIFFSFLLKELRKTVEKANLFGEEEDSAMRIYEDLLDERLAENMAQQGGLGIGAMVRTQLEEIQAAYHDPNSDYVKQRMAEQAAKLQGNPKSQTQNPEDRRTVGP